MQSVVLIRWSSVFCTVILFILSQGMTTDGQTTRGPTTQGSTGTATTLTDGQTTQGPTTQGPTTQGPTTLGSTGKQTATTLTDSQTTQSATTRAGTTSSQAASTPAGTAEGTAGKSTQSTGTAFLQTIPTQGPTLPPGVLFRCDFEYGFCGLSQDTNADFAWTRNSGGTPSSNTGPSVDHTLNSDTGHYVYIETSAVSSCLVARLVLPQTYSRDDILCLNFYYHMYGNSIRTLNVYLQSNSYMYKVWTMTSNQGNTWFGVNIDLQYLSSRFQVVFEGVAGDDVWGDIALDDITLQCGSCTNPDSSVTDGYIESAGTSTTSQYTQPYFTTDSYDCSWRYSKPPEFDNYYTGGELSCGIHEEGDIRLVDGGSPDRGRVEIYHNGSWGTICEDDFDDNEVTVICRQLGYGNFGGKAHYSAFFGPGSGPIWMDILDCNGHESHLANCPREGWGIHNCSHYEDVGVTCFLLSTVEYGSSYGGSYRLSSPGSYIEITSINYPDGYESNFHSEWTIYASSNSSNVHVVWEDFCTEMGFDFVSVGNGDIIGENTVINQFSGCRLPQELYSDEDSIWITFDTDVDIIERGFRVLIYDEKETCQSSSCHGNASCVDSPNGISCICPPLYTGLRCDIEHCQDGTCLRESECFDNSTGFSCLCPPGYIGARCEAETFMEVASRTEVTAVLTWNVIVHSDWVMPSITFLIMSINGSNAHYVQCDGTECCSLYSSCDGCYRIQYKESVYTFIVPIRPSTGGQQIRIGLGTPFYAELPEIIVEPVPLPPRNIAVMNVNSTTIVLSDDCYTYDGNLCVCQFDYIKVLYWKERGDVISLYSTSTTIVLSNLEQNQVYYMYVSRVLEGVESGGTLITRSTDLDECKHNPCPPNSICRDGGDGYNCVCNEGYAGQECDIVQCSDPGPISNSVSYGTAPFSHLAAIIITCASGYDLVGQATLICNNGTWDNSPPSCNAQCADPGPVSNSDDYGTGTFSHLAAINITCDSGYDLVGDMTLRCNNGSWDNPTPTCYAQCPDPGPVSNSDDYGTGTFSHLAAINITCDSGYDLVGDMTLRCNNGSWDNPTPTCYAQCPDPGPVSNSDDYGTGTFSHLAAINITCDSGYDLVGDMTLRCNNGSWDNPTPTCYAQCPDPGPVSNSDDYGTGTFSHLAAINITCDSGYDLVGDMTLRCNNGSWDNPTPTCYAQCPDPGPVSNSDDYGTGTFSHLAAINITCDSGYDLVGDMTLRCNNGSWDNPTPTCYAQCPDPGPVSNSDDYGTGTFSHLAAINITCDSGYDLVGDMTLRCNNGSWDNPTPTCYAQCPDPGPVSNSDDYGTGTFSHLAAINITCDSGYDLVGDMTLRCNNGSWDNPTPICYAQCPDPGPVSNSDDYGTGTFSHLAAINITCDSGYDLVGDMTLRCNNGSWDNPTPTCYAQCPDPGPVSNSDDYGTGTFSHLAAINITCDSGYDLVGDMTLRCNNGSWDNPTPICYAKCADPGPIRNSEFYGDGPFTHGSFINISCLSGYTINQELHGGLQCNDGYWNRATPRCLGFAYIITLHVLSQTTTTASIKWYEDFQNEILWDIFRYEVTFSTDDTSLTLFCSKCSEFELSNLRPGALHAITVTGISQHGSNISNTIIVLTDPAPPTMVIGAPYNSTSLDIFWQIGWSKYTSFLVTYYPASQPQNIDIYRDNVPYARLQGLQPNTPYAIHVQTVLDYGDTAVQSADSSTVYIQTGIDFCGTESNCFHGSTCVNTMDGFQCECQQGRGGETCSDIIVSDSCSSSPCRDGATCISETDGYTCICPDGFGGITCELSFSYMITLAMLTHTTTTASLRWNEIFPHGKVWNISEYDVTYTADGTSQIQQCTDCDGLELIGLIPGTAYEVTVTGYSTHGWNASNSIHVQTDPIPPLHIEVTSHSSSGITLYWQVGSTKYDSFKVTYNPRSQTENEMEFYTTTPMASLTALLSNTVYEIYVVTLVSFEDVEASSIPSPVINQKTDADYCDVSNCASGATCQSNSCGFKCSCPRGKGGETCEDILVPDSCSSSPCSGDSTCVNGAEGYICLCPDGFKGKTCEISTSHTEVMVSVSLEDAVFSDELTNKQSKEYKKLEQDIISEISQLYSNDEDFESVTIIQFKPGSIVVVMNIILSANATTDGGQSAVQSLTEFLSTNGLLNYTTGNVSYQTDQCQSSPCLNGGLCMSEGTAYTCYCRDNYIGLNCESVATSMVGQIQIEKPVEVIQRVEGRPLTNPLFDFSSLVSNPESIEVYNLRSHDYGIIFVLDSFTGQLNTTLSQFDRETNENFQLEVDLIGISINSSLILTINIVDINDNPPVFVDTSYTSTVMEYSPPGTRVTTIAATDADISSVLTYALAGSPTTNQYFKTLFSVESQTGRITLIGVLNRKRLIQDGFLKTDENIALPISVSDGESITNGAVFIDVVTLFVKQSTINETTHKVSVREDVGPGSFVVDVGLNLEDDGITYTYRIFESYKNFDINETTGVVTTSGHLDREEQDADNFTVIALENQCLTGSETYVIVTIEDVNDNYPIFDEDSYSATIVEDVGLSNEIQTVVIIPEIRATDRDTGINAQLTFSLSGNGHEQFSIDPKTGVVMTTDQINLDFETTKVYHLNVIARDMAGNVTGKSSVVPLIINVTDANDNKPIFTQSQISFQVAENIGRGTILTVVDATDADEGLNAKLLYSFQSGSEGKFSVDIETGELSVLSELDREMNDKYDIVIIARDQGLPVQQTSIDISITITDINDNTPQFTELHYVVHVSEDVGVSSSILTAIATDPDKYENGRVAYSLNNTSTFDVDSVSGTIYLQAALDRETMDSYTFDVIAKDGGLTPRSSVTTVRVIVNDINDNSPVFTRDVYSSTLLLPLTSQLLNGTIVTVVLATDEDIGTNAMVYYTVEHAEYNDTFDIDNTGIVRVSRDTVEQSNTITFDITARNIGDPSKFDTSRVDITIERPSASTILNFDNSLYEFNIQENVEGAQHIGTVQVLNVTDITYELTFEIPGISLLNKTGSIITSSPLDRESTPVLRFNVLARSDIDPDTFAFTTVIIMIEDVNDVTPYFKEPPGPVFTVSEGLIENQLNDSFLRLHVYDGDQGNNGKVVFSIISGNDDAIFNIHHIDHSGYDITGVISVNGTVDREILDTYNLIITVEDMGNVSLTSTITIIIPVIDVNDNTPTISTDTPTVTVQETVLNGTEVALVTASDPDTGVNNEISFKLTDNADGHFRIEESSGIIRTAKVIDREVLDQYTITVVAEDNGVPSQLSSTPLTITFDIEDYNDNKPQFVNLPYSVVLLKNSTSNSVIIQVQATDDDFERNAEITYDIIATGRCTYGLFSINASNGIVRNTRKLYNEPAGVCILSVRASDNGVTPLSTVVQIEVNITEVNNPPVFESVQYSRSIPENHPLGGAVNTQPNNPTAHDDLDEGENAVIVYEIQSGNNSDLFTINSNTGIISLAKYLDRETLDMVHFSIVAHDLSPDPKYATADVTITITDVNDNSPELATYHELVVPQDSNTGYIVAELNVSDADIGVNTECYFTFARARSGMGGEISPHTYFNIDHTKGIITTKDALYDPNRTSSISIEMIVVVSNQKPIIPTHIQTKPGPTFTWLNILVTYDYIPTCGKDVYTVSIPETTDTGTKLNITLRPDVNSSRVQPQQFFSITKGNVGNTFGIDDETNDVVVRNELDIQTLQYNLTISVTINDILVKTGTCFIIIDVQPVTTTASPTTTTAGPPATSLPISDTGWITIIGTSTLSAVLFLILIIVSTVCYGKILRLRSMLPKSGNSVAKEKTKVKKSKPRKTPKWVRGRPLPDLEGDIPKKFDEEVGVARDRQTSEYMRYMEGPKRHSRLSWDSDYNEVEDYLEPWQNVGSIPDYTILTPDYDDDGEDMDATLSSFGRI
ncbi:uncharacterized protein LOC144442158 [Glandiceps talaboti]